MSEFNQMSVSAIDRITAESVVLTIAVPEELKPSYQFIAGQYISLELNIGGTNVRRSYSICSAPHSGLLQVGVKAVPQGVFSTYVNQRLIVGDQIIVGTPQGRFIWKRKSNSLIAIAAGSGITPIMSIIKSALHDNPSASCTLLYGNKSPEKTMFYQELNALEEKHPHFKIHWVYSQENIPNAQFGRIDTSFILYALNQSSFSPETVYLCGPEKMITLSETLLREKGISQENIFFELFTAAEKTQVTNIAQKGFLEITCDEVIHKVELSPGKTLLEIALQAKIDVPYSCQGGVCSSCIGKITLGKATMEANQILTDDEIEQGLVLTCQAVAQSESVTVNYDEV